MIRRNDITSKANDFVNSLNDEKTILKIAKW